VLLALLTLPPALVLEDDGEREIGKGVGVNDETEGFENVGIVVVAVENAELDAVSVLSIGTVSFALNWEIEAC